MAIRQYIGARYVPKFFENPNNTAEWLPNVIYEPLTIVTYGLNTYTSKKTIPASVGDPANNPEYWVATGNFNEYINELREEMQAIITGTIRKYIFIGDSYGHSSGTNNGWIDKLVTMLGLTSDRYWDSALGGSGFGEHTTSYLDLLTTLVGTLTSEEKNSITDLVVIGGANDMAAEISTLQTNINSFVAYAKNQLPNVTIHIGMCSGNWLDNVIGIREPRTLEGYLSGSGYSYIDNIEYLLHDRSLVGVDRVHPTDTGYERIANFIYSYLIGGTNKVFYSEITTPTINTNTFDPITMRFNCTLDDSIARLSAGDSVTVTFAETTILSHGQGVNTHLNVNSRFIKGLTPRGNTNYDGFLTSVTFSIYSTGDNAWHEVSGYVSVMNGEIWVSNNDPRYRAPGSNYDLARLVTAVKLPVFQICGPTMFT